MKLFFNFLIIFYSNFLSSLHFLNIFNLNYIATYQNILTTIFVHIFRKNKNGVKMYHSKNSIIPFIVYYNIGIRKVKRKKSEYKQFSALSKKRVRSVRLFFASSFCSLVPFPNISPSLCFFFFLSLWKFIFNPLEGVAALLCMIDKWLLWAVLSTVSHWSLKNLLRFSSLCFLFSPAFSHPFFSS